MHLAGAPIGALSGRAPDAAPTSPWLSRAAAAAAGVLHTAAFAPIEAWWLQPLAFAGLVWLARAASPWRAAVLGWYFAFGWLSSGMWWLFISMHRYGDLPAPLAALAVALLAAALALYYAAALAAWARWRGTGAVRPVLLMAALWLAAELARASWFTGFPWMASGYPHTTGPLAGWAPWVGVYGLIALSAAISAALAHALHTLTSARSAKPGAPAVALRALVVAAVAGLLVAAGPWLPQDFTQSAGWLKVSLVQPNIAQDLKFDASRLQQNLDTVTQAVLAAPGDVVVTPESVVPLPFEALDSAFWSGLQAAVLNSPRAIMVGVFLPDGQGRHVNSLVGLNAAAMPEQARFYQYGKRHLLPFGEFIPPGFGWFVQAMNIPLGDQGAGLSTAPFVVAGQRLRPLICYEDLFGEDIVRSAVGPQAATIFVNVSNLAWFGTLMVQDQHLQFSRMRALEFQRPVVRATNTGSTAVVNHRGQVQSRLPPDVAATLNDRVEGRQGETPYARWLATAGLAPLWVFVVAICLWAVVADRRQSASDRRR